MPRIYKSARGEPVDFDAVVIKQQLAQAPMNIEVARRKEFIDNKEEKPRRTQSIAVPDGVLSNETSVSHEPVRRSVVPTDAEAAASVAAGQLIDAPKTEDFDEGVPAVVTKPKADEGPVPDLPNRG